MYGSARISKTKGSWSAHQKNNYRLCGIIDPTPAAPSFFVGRFQGNPLRSAGGGTAFRLFGSGDSHPIKNKPLSTISIMELIFISINRSQHLKKTLLLV
jgi:hypothetical protein